ncbi:hypothetical protein C8R47DRAFT_1254521 [Mycena vitilis]|nr:hypothetical protein C8R47DRAFT_1254521 [Mycena vitilis]
MEFPRMKTRIANKDTHPADKAGLKKGVRRTSAQMVQAREDETTAKARAALNAKKEVKRLAALEDKLQQDDRAYSATANHPPAKPVKAPEEATEFQSRRAQSGSDEDSEAYQPEENEEDDVDDDADGEDSDADPKKKKKGPSRSDVQASRSTQDSTGTPATGAAGKRKAPEKAKAGNPRKRPKTAMANKKSGLDDSDLRSNSKAKGAVSDAEDDSMVAPGGPALDDDVDERVERPATGKKKKGKPDAACVPRGKKINVARVDITDIARDRAVSRSFLSRLLAYERRSLTIKDVPKELTGRAARGGNAKWTLKHLPAGTADQFTSEVVPLACEQAGALGPWRGLTVKQIQGVVDRVFGVDVYKVAPHDVWVGLIGYRLHNWHNGFATHSEKGFTGIIDNDIDEVVEVEEEVAEVDEETAIPPTDGATLQSTVPLAAVPPVSNCDLKTPAGIAQFVAWALKTDGSGSMPFHWKQWGNGVDKKGFLQAELIMHAFSYHLSCLDAIPSGYTRLKERPVGALLMAVQAVQRTLQFWRTGVYINPVPMLRVNYFSSDNWDDHTVTNPNPNGKKDKLVRRATMFQSTVKAWDDERWNEVMKEAREFVEVVSNRRRAGSSRSASDADDSMYSEDEDVIIVSD